MEPLRDYLVSVLREPILEKVMVDSDIVDAILIVVVNSGLALTAAATLVGLLVLLVLIINAIDNTKNKMLPDLPCQAQRVVSQLGGNRHFSTEDQRFYRDPKTGKKVQITTTHKLKVF